MARFQHISSLFCFNYTLKGTHTLYLRNSEEISNKAVLLLLYMQRISNKMYASLALRLSSVFTKASCCLILNMNGNWKSLWKNIRNSHSCISYQNNLFVRWKQFLCKRSNINKLPNRYDDKTVY